MSATATTVAVDSVDSQVTDVTQTADDQSKNDLKAILSTTANYGRILQAASEGGSENLDNFLHKLGDIDVPTTLLIEKFSETSLSTGELPARDPRALPIGAAILALRVLYGIVSYLVDAIQNNKEVRTPPMSHVSWSDISFF